MQTQATGNSDQINFGRTHLECFRKTKRREDRLKTAYLSVVLSRETDSRFRRYPTGGNKKQTGCLILVLLPRYSSRHRVTPASLESICLQHGRGAVRYTPWRKSWRAHFSDGPLMGQMIPQTGFDGFIVVPQKLHSQNRYDHSEVRCC